MKELTLNDVQTLHAKAPNAIPPSVPVTNNNSKTDMDKNETNLSPADYRKHCLLKAKNMLGHELDKMAVGAGAMNHSLVYQLMLDAALAGFAAGVNAHADAITPEFTSMMITLAELEVEA